MYFVQNGGDIWNKFRNKEMMNPTLTKKYVVTKMFYFFFLTKLLALFQNMKIVPLVNEKKRPNEQTSQPCAKKQKIGNGIALPK